MAVVRVYEDVLENLETFIDLPVYKTSFIFSITYSNPEHSPFIRFFIE